MIVDNMDGKFTITPSAANDEPARMRAAAGGEEATRPGEGRPLGATRGSLVIQLALFWSTISKSLILHG